MNKGVKMFLCKFLINLYFVTTVFYLISIAMYVDSK
jgi:hypothetical protein